MPCCKECNCLLGAGPYYTVGQRAKFIQKKLSTRYSKILRIPEWESWELEELNGRLRQNVINSLLLKEDIKRRIEHAEYISIISPTIKEACEMYDG